MSTIAGLCVTMLALLTMEWFAYLTHRYVMHGWLWRWHASHHARREGWFELNDLFAVLFAGISVALIHTGAETHNICYWLGLGMVGYGLIYALFHDGLVHGRIPLPRALKQVPYLRHLVRAHYLHHATHTKHGAVSYGFMVAPPLERLRTDFKAFARARRNAGVPFGDRP